MKNRFPIGLTIATAISLAILCGLGGWQLKRLAWKQDLLARIEALKTAPAVPIGPVLERARAGEDVAWTRVSVECAADLVDSYSDWVRNSVRDGEIVWRSMSFCGLPKGSSTVILVDRGIIAGSEGAVKEPGPRFTPVHVAEGILAPFPRPPAGQSINILEGQGTDLARLILMVERETPPPSGLTPAAIPPDIANRHLEYALTWFGLAGALLAVYAALVRRRMKAP